VVAIGKTLLKQNMSARSMISGTIALTYAAIAALNNAAVFVILKCQLLEE